MSRIFFLLCALFLSACFTKNETVSSSSNNQSSSSFILDSISCPTQDFQYISKVRIVNKSGCSIDSIQYFTSYQTPLLSSKKNEMTNLQSICLRRAWEYDMSSCLESGFVDNEFRWTNRFDSKNSDINSEAEYDQLRVENPTLKGYVWHIVLYDSLLTNGMKKVNYSIRIIKEEGEQKRALEVFKKP